MTVPVKGGYPELEALAADMTKATAEPKPDLAAHALATVRSPAAETQLAASSAVNMAADAALGRLIRSIIDEAGGDGFATRDALTKPTMPGTPERKLQDKAEAAFGRRARLLVKGDGE